ncbi:hypothetical protein HAX54_027131 [Datura stramonium]|uniref:Uncharacterized protein n=1 Tax=Datura stramonium TaxID=4076 RepID=A0ABS8V486_DATST|nr:hypothetical protein [Datura stramonium]
MGSATIAVRNPQTIPTGGQNFFEYVLDFIRDVRLFYLGKSYNYLMGELAAPTNDINTTVALALLTSMAYFYAGLTKKGIKTYHESTDFCHFRYCCWVNGKIASIGPGVGQGTAAGQAVERKGLWNFVKEWKNNLLSLSDLLDNRKQRILNTIRNSEELRGGAIEQLEKARSRLRKVETEAGSFSEWSLRDRT